MNVGRDTGWIIYSSRPDWSQNRLPITLYIIKEISACMWKTTSASPLGIYSIWQENGSQYTTKVRYSFSLKLSKIEQNMQNIHLKVYLASNYTSTRWFVHSIGETVIEKEILKFSELFLRSIYKNCKFIFIKNVIVKNMINTQLQKNH